MSMRFKTNGMTEEFQNIHNLNELNKNKDNTYYKGIKREFLYALLGEDYEQIYDNAWDDRDEFMKEYRVEYTEWNRFEE